MPIRRGCLRVRPSGSLTGRHSPRTAALAPLGVVLVALWIDDLAHLMVGGPALTVVVTQLTLIMAVCAIVAARFEYLTLYRMELRASQVIGRSTLKSWTFSLSDIEAIVPGWVRPWWSADHNRYVVKFADGHVCSFGAARG